MVDAQKPPVLSRDAALKILDRNDGTVVTTAEGRKAKINGVLISLEDAKPSHEKFELGGPDPEAHASVEILGGGKPLLSASSTGTVFDGNNTVENCVGSLKIRAMASLAMTDGNVSAKELGDIQAAIKSVVAKNKDKPDRACGRSFDA